MGFDHSLSMTTQLKPGTTLDAVIVATKPILGYFGYDGHEAFAGQALYDGHIFKFDPQTLELSIYTCGEVSNYQAHVEECAENIAAIAMTPGVFFLHNYSTPELDRTITQLYFGESEEVINRYRFKSDLEAALESLAHHLAADVIESLRETALASYRPVYAQPPSPSAPSHDLVTPVNELVAMSSGGRVDIHVTVRLPVATRITIDHAVLEQLANDPTLKPVIARELAKQFASASSEYDIAQAIDGYVLGAITDGVTGALLSPAKEEVHAGYVQINGSPAVQIEFAVPDGASKAEKDSAFLTQLAHIGTVGYLSLGYQPKGADALAVAA